jgi:rhamnogalacturonyl hydrolase YesR
MRKFIFLLPALLVLLSCQKADSQDLPDRNKVLALMELANSHFMRTWPDVAQESFVRNRYRPSHIWTRGVYYEGLMALHQICPREQYYRYAYNWGKAHNWELHRGNTTRNADNHCAGQTYIALYNISPDPALIKNIKTSMDMLVNTPQNNDWSWIDAIQMGMPIFAQLGQLTGDQRYYEKAYQMYMFTRNQHGPEGLYNPKDGLWWRDADFCPPYTEPNGEDCYWSRGNGWVYAALARYMEIAPADEKYRAQYLKDFRAMSKALLACQREDGYWNVSLHDPDHFGGKETSGTALFVFGMAWGIRQGILPAKTYLPAVIKGWKALEEAVHPSGFLGYVQGTGKEPKDGQPVGFDQAPDFDDYGLGCFLLAGSEVYKLDFE